MRMAFLYGAEDEKAAGYAKNWYNVVKPDKKDVFTLEKGIEKTKLAGMMCLSGYVPIAAKAAAEHTQASLATPVFMVHGRMDPVIPVGRAEQSRDLLQQLGYNVEWHDYPMQHSVCQEEVAHISAWLKKVLA